MFRGIRNIFLMLFMMVIYSLDKYKWHKLFIWIPVLILTHICILQLLVLIVGGTFEIGYHADIEWENLTNLFK